MSYAHSPDYNDNDDDGLSNDMEPNLFYNINDTEKREYFRLDIWINVCA